MKFIFILMIQNIDLIILIKDFFFGLKLKSKK